MRWPWVSRELYESQSAAVDRLLDYMRDYRSMYDALLEKYHALKVNGATVTTEPRTVEAKEPDAVQYAINEKSGSNTALRFHLTRWAAREAMNGQDTESIVKRLSNWQSEQDDD